MSKQRPNPADSSRPQRKKTNRDIADLSHGLAELEARLAKLERIVERRYPKGGTPKTPLSRRHPK